jgi:S1-C subfamily serine protease
MGIVSPAALALALGLLGAGGELSEAQSLRDVFQRVNASVVLIEAKGTPTPAAGGATAEVEEGVGSGVLISADGKVLTAAHVVRGADEIAVRFTSGDPVPARVVASAPFADVALLQLASVPPGATVASFGDSDALAIGDQVFTIGAPYGANHSLAVGWISARRTPQSVYEDATALEVFQTDLAIYEGNSGGPLFTLDGEVVGIVTHVLAKEGQSTGPGFAVTGNLARKLMIEQRRAWFGVESLMLDGDLARAFHLPQPAGLLAQSVATGSLADRLGIRGGSLPATVGDLTMILGGDVLLEVHGVPVSSSPEFFAAFTSALDRVRSGEVVTVRVWRGGASLTLKTTAGEP